MKEYKKPEYHLVRNPDGLSGDEIAKLSEDELTRYLDNDSYRQGKKKYRIRPGYILREIAGEYAIIPVGAERNSLLENSMMAPNGSAVFIWKCFEQASTIEDVFIKCLMEYDVTEEVLRKELTMFVTEALEYKILEEAEENETSMGKTKN